MLYNRLGSIPAIKYFLIQNQYLGPESGGNPQFPAKTRPITCAAVYE
jgi:hypothetical protein